jgi:DNA-binding NtrC family response regulator
MMRQVERHEQEPDGRASYSPFNLQEALARFERGYVQNVLQLTQWDLEAAARLLEIAPTLLTRKMTEYHLHQHTASSQLLP